MDQTEEQPLTFEQRAERRAEISRQAVTDARERVRDELEVSASKLRERSRQHNPVGMNGGGQPTPLEVRVEIETKRGRAVLLSREEAETLSSKRRDSVVEATAIVRQIVDQHGPDAIREIVRNRETYRDLYRPAIKGRAVFIDESIAPEIRRAFVEAMNV